MGYGFSLAVLIALVLWAYHNNTRRYCAELQVDIRPAGLHFIAKEEVTSLVELYARRPVLGQPSLGLFLHDIEQEFMTHDFIETVDLSRLHNGNLNVAIEQKRPLARVWYGKEAYLSAYGALFPLSKSYTPRVMLLDIEKQTGEKQTGEKQAGEKQEVPRDWSTAAPWQEMYQLVQRLQAHPFWQKQIARIELNRLGYVRLYGQIGDQRIEFGKIEEVDAKLNKLFIFYTQILPAKGWNKYQVVDLRFNNQIVCR